VNLATLSKTRGLGGEDKPKMANIGVPSALNKIRTSLIDISFGAKEMWPCNPM
jgi:hypothetical protein